LERAKDEVEVAEELASLLLEAAAAGEAAGAAAGEAAAAGAAAADPSPVRPPVAPVAAILESASAVVVQVMEVPALLTRGRAAQTSPPAHWVTTKEPATH